MSDSQLRIMVASDNHLGFCDTDALRCRDSLAAFEEVLRLSKDEKVDMVLLGGDLFHENKPTRWTMHNTIKLFEKYALGDEAVGMEILSDQKVNFEHEHLSVGLPIFSIHGNHDEPSRDGLAQNDALAALDMLAGTRLINYFGRQDSLEKVEIHPIIIKKGDTHVALYGLGNIRDARLNHMWHEEKLQFMRAHLPDADDEDEEDDKKKKSTFFNILILHQNRDLGRGSQSCINESLIPDWMDLVIWGHEHESKIDPWQSASGGFWISQPGSSVATSPAVDEAGEKHCGVLTIDGDKFKIDSRRLSMVRPFLYKEVILGDSDILAAQLRDRPDGVPQKEITKVLASEVAKLLETAPQHEPRYPDQEFQLLEPSKVLVRLRVNHRGFQRIHNQKFGSEFIDRVANPAEMLLWTRAAPKGAAKTAGTKKKTRSRGGGGFDDEDFEEEDEWDYDVVPEEDPLAQGLLEDLFKRGLNDVDLRLLQEEDFLEALQDVVHKSEPKATVHYVDRELAKSQKQMAKTTKIGDVDGIEAKIQENTNAKRTKKNEKKSKKKDDEPPPRAAAANDDDDDDDDLDDDDEEEEEPPKKKAAATKKRGRQEESDDESDDEDRKKPAAKKPAPKKPAPKKPARRGRDDDSDEESVPAAKTKAKPAARKRGRDDELDDDSDEAPKPAASRRSGRAKAPVSYAAKNDDDDDIEEIEEDEPPKKKGRKPAVPKKKTTRGGKTAQESIIIDSDSD